MAETWLTVRDGNGNCNSSPMFLLSVWGHLRILRVSKNMDASCRRKSNNGKRTRKQTQLIHFERCNEIEICNGIMLNFYPGQPHFIQISSTTLLARFSQHRKRSILWELVKALCNTHFHLSSLLFYTSIAFIGVF